MARGRAQVPPPEITATPRYADAMPTKFRLWFPLAEVRTAKNAWFI